ncbi:MAG: hypothetical protein JW867_03355 [Candidatus Omnitrophica bacterium]|nr:hypothetical protein [Candidatus Omnitrophota bacterium]
MQNRGRKFLLAALSVFLFLGVCPADEVSDALNQYYGALAKILSKNIDDPDKAVSEVSAFIRRNINFINSVRQLRDEQKSLSYGSASSLISSDSSEKRDASRGIDDFNKVMTEFKRKNPVQAQKLELLGMNSILKPL